MLRAMQQVALVVKHLDFERFENDLPGQMIVERGLEIVSEASKGLSDDLKERHPDTPWRDIKGMGDRLRHEYHRIDQATIWDIAISHIPKLEKVCRIELDREKALAPKLLSAKDMADQIMGADRELSREKPAPEPKIDPTPGIGPDYSKGMELRRKRLPDDET